MPREIRFERLAGALAVACLALMALLAGNPSFTNAAYPQRGISSPVIAVEMARSLNEIDDVLGDAPSPDREVLRLKEYIDFAYLAAVLALSLTLAKLLSATAHPDAAPKWPRAAASAAVVCAIAAAAFGILENIFILRMLNVPLLRTTPSLINTVRGFSAGKWLLSAFTLALLSIYFWRAPAKRRLMLPIGALLCIAAALSIIGLADNPILDWQSYPLIAALLGMAVAWFRLR